jgi:hypothetical protein
MLDAGFVPRLFGRRNIRFETGCSTVSQYHRFVGSKFVEVKVREKEVVNRLNWLVSLQFNVFGVFKGVVLGAAAGAREVESSKGENQIVAVRD